MFSSRSYTVAIVQNPTLSLAGDVDATNHIIDAQSEPVILVGHSYGGAVITEAGNNPKVEKLVYITAFVPDKGESVNTLSPASRPTGRSRRFCPRGRGSCPSTGKVPCVIRR